jgi:hypothetical protein
MEHYFSQKPKSEIRKENFKMAVVLFLPGIISGVAFYTMGLPLSIKHLFGLLVSPVMFWLFYDRTETPASVHRLTLSLLPIMVIALFFFAAYQSTEFKTKFLTLHHEFYRGIISSLLMFTFYGFILASLFDFKNRKYLLTLGPLVFLLGKSKLWFISSLYPLMLNSKLPRRFKQIALALLPVTYVLPFFVNKGFSLLSGDLAHYTKIYLNGRLDLYSVFQKNLSFFPNGIGFSSNQVFKHLSSIYPEHEITSHMHNVHMELIIDFGLVLYLILLMAFSLIAYRKKLYFTSFIVFAVLSFGYTIYSPLTAILLALGVRFDVNRQKFEIGVKS